MGFGSYDESEQEKREVDTDIDDSEALDTGDSDHGGSVEFEFTASNDELLERLRDMKDEEEE